VLETKSFDEADVRSMIQEIGPSLMRPNRLAGGGGGRGNSNGDAPRHGLMGSENFIRSASPFGSLRRRLRPLAIIAYKQPIAPLGD